MLPRIRSLQYSVPVNLLNKKGYYLYEITNNFDDKVYVGYTSQKPAERIRQHARLMKKGKANAGRSYLYPAAKLHGMENFVYTLLAVFDSEASGLKAEDDLVVLYKANGRAVYNVVPGGGGVGSGENHPNYGKTTPEETRVKMSEAQKGEKGHMYGKKLTDEARAKISGATKGENNPNYKYDPVLIASYVSQKEASEATGIDASTYYRIKKANPALQWPIITAETISANLSKVKTKYPPELIASYPSQQAAVEDTGIHPTTYNRIKLKHPDLPWPISVRGKR
jgi:group I intron endonuclease